MTWQILIGNLAVVALIISLWSRLRPFLQKRGLNSKFSFGVAMGLGSVGSMLLSVELAPGEYFDLRAALIASSALFGGPVAVLTASAIAVGFRVAMGGAGVLLGVAWICMSAVVSLITYQVLRGREPGAIAVLFNSALLTVGFLLLSLSVSRAPDLAFASINFAGLLTCGAMALLINRHLNDGDILRAALQQGPDFHYVKNLDSEFVIANENVAHINGFQYPSQLVGLTDFAITTNDRAALLRESEVAIMRTGKAAIDIEDCVTD